MAENSKSLAAPTTHDARLYPRFAVPNNEHPNKLYGFPLLGYLIKLIMVIPALLFIVLLSIAAIILWLILPFVILFKGKYWDTAFNFFNGYLIYSTKIGLFIAGVTDKYPGFNLQTNGIFELTIKKPATSNRLLGFPLIGFIIRAVLMIPFYIYQSVLSYGGFFAVIASWFGVTFKGKYRLIK